MHAKDDLKTAHDNATQAHEHAIARLRDLDALIAAFDTIADVISDSSSLTDDDRVALGRCNGRSAAKHTLIAKRKALAEEIISIEEVVSAAWRAYDAEPEDVN